MITVEKALSIVREKTVPTLKVKEVRVENALGYVLSENVLSPIDMPPFPQSAMDGYAVNCQDETLDFTIVDEIQAGEVDRMYDLKSNQAVRIFTGAVVPDPANMVIRQEDTTVNGAKLEIHTFPKPMANIRPQGEQIRKGQIALLKGHEITERSIGYLASIGVNKVSVYEHPKITIISTGNELVSLGQTLKPGQIYESNALMIQSALQSRGYKNVTVIKLKDDLESTIKAVANALASNDLLICSGGISVGDYDFIGTALEKNNVVSHFYKVKQKPGKPLYFGQKDKAYVFGLPGNPAACLTGFYVYILPFLSQWKGSSFKGLNVYQAQLKKDYSRRGDRAEFLKALVNDQEVEILEGQSSAMLKSFSEANAIIYIPIEKSNILAGELVRYYAI